MAFGWLRKLFAGASGPNAGRTDALASASTSDQPVSSYMVSKVRIGRCSDRGRRENNEDNLYVDPQGQLFVVADGMGGQAAGEIASQIAVDLIPQLYSKLNGAVGDEDLRRGFQEIFRTVNDAILQRGHEDPTAQNLGTTAVVVLLLPGKAMIASIGDSRAYRLRGRHLDCFTKDHNLAQALFDAGTITKEELANHRYKNVLFKYLGMKEAGMEPDVQFFDLKPGDRFLLASDGVTGSMADEDLQSELTKRADPQACAVEVVRKAIENGSKDNATCVVVYADEG